MENDKKATILERIDHQLTSDRRWLYALFGGSFLLKLLYLVQSSGSLHVQVPIMDSEYYDRVADEILSGRLVREDAYFMGPLYPYFLAVVYAVFGKSYAIVRLIQFVGGAATVVLTYVLGRRVFRPCVAALGAVMLGLYATITFYEGQLLMMWLGTLLNMTALVLLHRSTSRGVGNYAIVGVLLGLSALARGNILIFLPVIVLWLWLVSGDTRRVAKAASLLAAMVAMILPATIHNYIASRDFVPITSNAGVNFYIGNSADATGVYIPPKGINIVDDSSIETYVERVMGRELKPSEVSRYWFDEALTFIKQNPKGEILLVARKLALLLSGYEVPQIEAFELARERYGALRLMFVNFWTIVSLSLVGLVFTLRHGRRYFLLHGFVFSMGLAIILFFVTARYRVQIVPLLCLFAAYGAVEVLPTIFRDPRRLVSFAVVFVTVLVVTRPGLFAIPREEVLWREHTHQARRLNQVGKVEEAIAEIDRAVEIHPDYAESYLQRAVIYKAQGNLFKAVEDYERALRIAPNMPTVHYDLAQTLRQLKMLEPAIESYQNAIKLSPRMVEAYNNLGITYREAKRPNEAFAYFEKAIEINPRYARAYNNLGAAYAEGGDLDSAITVLKRAIEVDPTYASSYKNLAMAYTQQQRVGDATNALRRYLELVPGDERAAAALRQLQAVLDRDTLP